MTDLFEEACPHCQRPFERQEPVSGFAQFWNKVPHKIGRANAEKAWKKLSAADRQIAAEKVTAFYDWFAKAHPTASSLHPSTYLNGKRWLDEPISGSSKAISEEAKQAIRNGLRSTIPSVREHAQKMAAKAGVQV